MRDYIRLLRIKLANAIMPPDITEQYYEMERFHIRCLQTLGPKVVWSIIFGHPVAISLLEPSENGRELH